MGNRQYLTGTNGGYHTAVILYPTYERMNNYLHNAAILNYILQMRTPA